MDTPELEVACYRCGATIGDPCRVRRTGRPCKSHAPRVADWKAHRAHKTANEWNRLHPVGTAVRLDLGPVGPSLTRRTADTVTTCEAWANPASGAVVVSVAHPIGRIALRFVTVI